MRYQVPGFLYEMCKKHSPTPLPWQALLSPPRDPEPAPWQAHCPGPEVPPGWCWLQIALVQREGPDERQMGSTL